MFEPTLPRPIGPFVLAFAAFLGWLTCTPLQAAPDFKIYVEQGGVYQLTFADLVEAGLEADSLASAGLGLTCAGEDAPIWVADGGDGSFGPGDRIEFVGEHLRGEVSYFNEHSRYNVYVLTSGVTGPARMKSAGDGVIATPSATYRHEQHLEEDLVLLRLAAKEGETDELWYWAKLVFNAKEPYTRKIDLSHLDACASCEPTKLTIALRGWSEPQTKPDPEMKDHRVDVVWNGEPVATAEWNGTRPYLLEVPSLGTERLHRGENTLQLSVPRRRLAAKSDRLIDVVMLNWIEISYPRDDVIDEIDEQTHLELVAPASAGLLRSTPGRQLVAFGAGGSRSVATRGAKPGESIVAFPAGESSYQLAHTDALLNPAAVVYDRPSRLRDREQQADYIVIAHRTLLEAVLPLVELHRSRGLAVEVVDLQDVYDEFHHGVTHPRAIRSFLQYAFENWRSPAPRFVLLVGDASWDARNARADDENYTDWTYRPGERARFSKNKSHTYVEGAELNHRGLVPTWNHPTYQGHSASDNFFVAFDGDDFLPDMAIGRLPVVEPEEVAGIVAKTVRYATTPEVGPWRRNALLITNESKGFQRQSDGLARQLALAGFGADKVYPASTEVSNEQHTKHLLEAFDQGQLFVHFLGHGGRYIWRTGPPDPAKNHDLFTLEHLDQLAPGGRLPIVLSLTCYSAPFDHPNADSIGEKLLRLDERGAIAVFAASWRNSPRQQWGQVLLEELTQPGTTIGEAILRSKHRITNRTFVETYNLLGDPALPVALPSGSVTLDVSGLDGEPLHITGTVDFEDFTGEVLVEAVDGNGDALASITLDTDAPGFALDLELGDEIGELRIVSAYAWNSTRNIDAAGSLQIPLLAEAPTPDTSGKTRP